MLEFLLFLKFFVAIAVVLGLSVISERVSPRIAGFISGLPTGTLITLFFFGLELGPGFAAKSAIFNLSGMLALMTFILVYYKASERFESLLVCSLVSILAYFVVIYILSIANLGPFPAALTLILSIPVFIYLFRGIENNKIGKKAKLDMKSLVLRSIIAAVIILAVISVAGLVGPSWAGLLSAFPTTLFPLILITHFTYGAKPVHTIIKNVPQGIFGLVVYSLGVYYLYPILGVYLGTLISYLLVIIYSILYFVFKR